MVVANQRNRRSNGNAEESDYGEYGSVDDASEYGILETEIHQQYNEARKNFKFISDERFDRLTIGAKKDGATIIRGDPQWEKHLVEQNASAATIGNIMIFRTQVCVSEVLEETRHFYQNRIGMNGDKPVLLQILLNEIEAR